MAWRTAERIRRGQLLGKGKAVQEFPCIESPEIKIEGKIAPPKSLNS
jgi:hypothetical protein